MFQATLGRVADQDRSQLVASLTAALQEMVGHDCWGVIAGKSSVVGLHIGPKLKRAQPVQNPLLSAELREYDGQYGIMIMCAWRLDTPTEVVAGSGDPAAGGPTSTGLDRITGKRITAIAIAPPAMDLVVSFEGDLTLKVFCDGTDVADDSDNILVFSPSGAHGVGARGAITLEIEG
jgi:hypothetical protein